MKKSSTLRSLIIAILSMAAVFQAAAQATYTWNQAGGGNWATATNWTPSRTTPATNDILVINNGGTKTITNVLTQTIGRLLIGGNTNVTLTPNGAARTLTISNTGSALEVQSGSSLALIGQSGGGTRSLTVRFTGASNTALIAGTLSANITSNDPGIFNTANCTVSVTDSLVNNGGTISSSAVTLTMASGGQYRHTINGGTIPAATWAAGSLCRVTGSTSNVPGGLNQAFADFTWDCTAQSANLTLNGQLTTVNGNLTINHTDLYYLMLSSANNSTYTLNVGGNMEVNDDVAMAIVAGDNIIATVNVAGNFILSGASSSASYFDFYILSGGSATMNKIVMNVTGNYIQSGGYMDLAYGESNVAAFNELQLAGNFQLSGSGVLTTGTGDASITNGVLIFNKTGTQTYSVTNPNNIGYVNYQVNSGSTLEVLSEVILSSHTTAVWAGQFTVTNGGILNAGSQRITSSTGGSPGNNNAFILQAGGRIITADPAGLQVDASTGTISTSLSATAFNSGADYEFAGNATGTFTTSPVANTVRNLVINNTGGTVTLNQPLAVSGALQLSNGILSTSMTNLLTINDDATASAGNYSPASFVEGPLRKIGNDAFTFPVGKLGVYAPASISAPGAVNAEYRAEYFRSAPPNRTNITAPGLVKVSLCEYWDIEEVGPGSPTVDVSLSWSGFSPCNAAAYVTDLASLTVAHFDGVNWNSHSNSGGFGGTAIQGNVTRNSVSTFSIFTLGSTSAISNPLSVKFTAVKAYTSGNLNIVEWTNQSEAGVIGYSVEKSTDGILFTALSEVAARSNAATREVYNQHDLQPGIKTYYRIKATELSGEVSYSPVVKVVRGESGSTTFSIYPNPVQGKQFTLQYKGQTREPIRLQLFSSSGVVVYSNNWIHPGGQASQTVELPLSLSKGMYYLQLNGNNRSESRPVMIQ